MRNSETRAIEINIIIEQFEYEDAVINVEPFGNGYTNDTFLFGS